ncbi:MAG: class I SAM-dependent methyltransferase [Sedimentisphaerales bacterium]|nr:class I SAM-dependent methyltransferase [Sedimentisphaerales bacterium]
MEDRFRLETEKLLKSWSKHDRTTLRNYLVEDVQDPRINIQSILSRHWLVEKLFGEKFADLAEHELRFGLVVNWLLELLKRQVRTDRLQAVLYALISGQKNAEGIEIPSYISQTFAGLALPNYICDLLNWAPVESTDEPVPEYIMTTFQRIWSELLAEEKSKKISVLEPACGSANDYRFIDSFGISGFINYTGFDLCAKNIRNARQMFPEIDFRVGNVFEIPAEDNAFDYCFVHDLFEHFSLDALEIAVSEICRVTSRSICIGFFNMHEDKDHIVQNVDDYHWNKLSVSATKKLFERYASTVQIVHIEAFLASRFECRDVHNKNAYTFIADF